MACEHTGAQLGPLGRVVVYVGVAVSARYDLPSTVCETITVVGEPTSVTFSWNWSAMGVHVAPAPVVSQLCACTIVTVRPLGHVSAPAPPARGRVNEQVSVVPFAVTVRTCLPAGRPPVASCSVAVSSSVHPIVVQMLPPPPGAPFEPHPRSAIARSPGTMRMGPSYQVGNRGARLPRPGPSRSVLDVRRSACLALALGIVSLPSVMGLAAPANKLDAATVAAFGGSWAPDCHKPGLRVRVAEDTLAVAVGKKEVASHDVQRATIFAGGVAPADYLGSLLGDVAGGEPLVFHVYRDARGLSLAVDAGAKLLATFGKSALAPRFHRCDSGP